MSYIELQMRELRALLAAKDRLILSLADKLAIVAEHLGKLSERSEMRSK